MDEHKDWTRYHIIHTLHYKWKFYHEGAKRAIVTRYSRSDVIKEALYYMSRNGGVLTVHYRDGSVDFVVDNWCG